MLTAQPSDKSNRTIVIQGLGFEFADQELPGGELEIYVNYTGDGKAAKGNALDKYIMPQIATAFDVPGYRHRLTIGKGGILTYEYDTAEDCSFKFHTFNEVGEPYQPWFNAEFQRLGIAGRIKTREIEQEPWVADFLVLSE